MLEEARVIRGLWAQRLLWLMGGNLAFFPSSDFVASNSHFQEESTGAYCAPANTSFTDSFPKELNHLLEFMRKWEHQHHQKGTWLTQGSMFELTKAMSNIIPNIWGKELKLLKAWLDDMKLVFFLSFTLSRLQPNHYFLYHRQGMI